MTESFHTVNNYDSKEVSMGNLGYKALALDLDGTLTDSNKNLPTRNKEVLKKAMDLGLKVILISGRSVMGITGLAEELDFKKYGGIIAAFNGGKIFDYQTGETIQQLMFPAKAIANTCAIVRKYGAQPLSYTDTHIVAETDTDEYVLKECKCNSTTVQKVSWLPDFLDYPIPKILGAGEHEQLLKARDEFLAMYSDICDSFFAESFFLELAPKGVAKDKALSKVCDYLNITPKELMACGDGLNDISMLDFAGWGVAMKNAYPETLAMADCIAPFTNDECGVAWAVETFILNA